jgi:ribosomal protein L32
MSLMLLSPAKAEDTISLPTNTYRDHTFEMGSYDCYKWEFTSSSEEILLLALTHEQFDAFYNQYVSDYTAFLNKHSGFQDSGLWRPPHSSTWHFIYINTGDFSTQLTIIDSVIPNYYFPWIALIIGLSIGIPLLALTVYFAVKKIKKKKRVDNQPGKQYFKPSELSHSIPTNQQDTKLEFCPSCGTKVTIGKFCMSCGFDMSKL